MRYCNFSLSVLLIAASAYSQWKEKPGRWETLRLTRTAPNTGWSDAWGIGNGRLAAKTMCNVKNEKIFLNDNTFWPGYPRDFSDPATQGVFKEVRRLLLEGKNAEADNRARQLQSFHCFPYSITGNLFLDFDHGSSASNFKSIENLDSAMVQVRYTVDGVNYTREIFVSYPDQVVVLRLSADKSGKLGFAVRMNAIDVDNLKLTHKVWTEGDGTLVMQGFADYAFGSFVGDTSQMKFDARVRVSVSGGSSSASGSSLSVAGADTALLILSIGTSYNGPFKHPSPSKEGLDPTPIAKGYLEKAAMKTYRQLLSAHLQDYQGIFRRLWIELNGENPYQYALDFQFIRFEVLQCSRGPRGQPMTLKGIWNNKVKPEWYGHYTINSEGPKPYWTAEAGNMAEAIDPVTNFVEELAVTGAKTAKINYGCRGWCAHHNADLWKHSSMVGKKEQHPYWVCWMFGGIFMAQLLSEHYKFSGDVKYLRDHAYPVLKGAALFCLDYLIDNGKGHLVPAPSTSPENMYRYKGVNDVAVCLGATCDLAHIRQTFLDVMEFSKVLNVDAPLRDSIAAAYAKLLPFQIGKQGQLQEWCEDYVENEPHHRHASHLAAIFPYGLITPRGTPELWKAAKKSMELRGNEGDAAVLFSKDGWWARLLEGDKALWGLETPMGPFWATEEYGGYPELLLQSHAGEIELLPALPGSWKSGKVLGLRGRTGYEVDIEWANNVLVHATIRSSLGTTPIVRIQGDSVPDPKTDPRITLEYITGVAKESFDESIGKTIAMGRLSAIAIPYRGAYSVSVVTIRGQVVESVRGTGPATVRLATRNRAPGLYVLRITAAGGKVALVKTINTIIIGNADRM